MVAKTRIALILSGIFVCLHLSSLGAEYTFTNVKTKDFPVSDPYKNYLVGDINGDGIDELILFCRSSYYIYSFETDSVLFKDTGLSARGAALIDHNNDHINDLLLNASATENRFYLQDGRFTEGPQRLTDTTLKFETAGTNEFGAYIMDTTYGGPKSVVSVCAIGFSAVWGSGSWQEFHCGAVYSLNLSEWRVNWAIIPDKTTPWFGVPYLAADHSVAADINNDGNDEILAWGVYHYEGRYPGPNGTGFAYDAELFNVVSADGKILYQATSNGPIVIAAGDIDPDSPGDEFIFYSRNASVNLPGISTLDSNGIYCLHMVNDTMRLLWSRPVNIYQGGLDGNISVLPSIPGVLCVSGAGSSYLLLSGGTGQQAGFIFGLDSGRVPIDGRFLSGSNQQLTMVQISGASAKLFKASGPTDADNHAVVPSTFDLKQNRPNPFNGTTRIDFVLTAQSQVDLSIYNLLGEKLTTLYQGSLPAGDHACFWNGTDAAGATMASGLYFYRLKAGQDQQIRKMIVLK